MKYLVILAFLLIPSVSLAAPLTVDQATSLINVVQSSPTTPASAFTDLITAFSNITVPQAEGLITVVQAAPGVPATAFVNMLIAFTVDTIIAQTQTTAPAPEPTPTISEPTFGTQTETQPTTPIVDSPIPTPVPVVQSPVMSIDTKSPALSLNELHNGTRLRIATDEPIVSILPQEGQIVETIIDGVKNPGEDYYYVYTVSGFLRTTMVTVVDAAGNQTVFRPRWYAI